MNVKQLQQLLEMLPEDTPVEIWVGTDEYGKDCYAEVEEFIFEDGVLKL